MTKFWKSNWFIALCLFVIVLAVGLRFMSAGLVHYDSVRLAQAVEAGRMDWGRPGMFLLVSAVYAPTHLAGYDADFAVRLTGVLFLALCAAALCLLAFEMMRSRVGAVAAALLLVVTPLFVMPATYGKEHSAALFFLILAFWCAVRGNRSRQIAWPMAASLLFVISLSIRELGIVILPAFIWFLCMPRLVSMDGKKHLVFGRRSLAGLLSLAVFLAVALWLFLFQRIAALLGDQGTAGVVLASHYLPLALVLIQHTGFQWLFVLLGLYACWRIGRNWLIPLLLWFAPIVVIISLGGFLPRYLDIVLVPWVLFASFGIAWLAHRWLVVSVLVALLLVMSTFWLAVPFLELRHNTSNLADFGRYVASVTEPNALIIAFDESAFVEFYGHRNATSLSPTPATKEQDANWLVSLQNNGTPVYVLSSSYDYYDAGNALQRFLELNFALTTVGAYPMENYHDAETGVILRNVSIIKIGQPLSRRNMSAVLTAGLS